MGRRLPTIKIADIVIPHHDRHDHLKECLESFDNSLFNIIIISGGTFAQNCNKGARLSVTDKLIFLNDDTLPTKEQLIELAESEDDITGATQEIIDKGARENNNNIYYGIGFDIKNGKLHAKQVQHPEEVKIPGGFCFAVKTKVWVELGGFDEEFRNGGEDSDFGFRATEKGYKIGYCTNPIKHKHSQSTGRLMYHKENQELLDKKWDIKKLASMFNLKNKEYMDILVVTDHLSRLGGSETFTYTMVKELEKQNHKVDVFTFHSGIISEKLNTTFNLQKQYDYIFVNHNNCLQYVNNIVGKKIFTSHGVYPAMEQPINGADKYIAISEEVQAHMKNLGFTSDVILNGIDCERFKPTKPINEKPKKVLCSCQGEQAKTNVKRACDMLGLEYLEGHSYNPEDQIWDMEKLINECDIVIGLGRTAYEAMACGRVVIVYDTRCYDPLKSADGLVTPETINQMVKCNCSGRHFKKPFTEIEIIDAINAYDIGLGKFNRNWALENLNIEKQINKYLNE